MAFSRPLLVALEAAVTAGANATAKTTALVDGIVAAMLGEPFADTLSPNQQNHIAALQTELDDNVNALVTALVVA